METLIDEARQLRADLESYGMVKLSDASNVTDSTGMALPVTEKNPDIRGTLASEINNKSIYLGIVEKKDTELNELAEEYKVPSGKPYIITIVPAGDNGEYVQAGGTHVVLGMSYVFANGKFQYGFQVSFLGKILFRNLYSGVWGDWVEAT